MELRKEFIVNDFVIIGKKKYSLNLNVYRNAHFQVLNKMKIAFKENLYSAYPELFKIRAQKAVISYVVQPYNKVLFDTKNITCIVDKFFCDAIVESGTIPDDNYRHVSYLQEYTLPPIPTKNRPRDIIITCVFSD